MSTAGRLSRSRCRLRSTAFRIDVAAYSGFNSGKYHGDFTPSNMPVLMTCGMTTVVRTPGASSASSVRRDSAKP